MMEKRLGTIKEFEGQQKLQFLTELDKKRIYCNNEPSEIRVYVSEDYSIFKKMKGNRDLDLMNLLKLKKSMEDTFFITPIYVNEYMEVVDGQHRLEILQIMGKPIYYIILEGATTQTVHNFNNVSLKWSLIDYAKSYAALEYPQYVTFMEYYEKHKAIPMSVLYKLLSGLHRDVNQQNVFKTGHLELLNPMEIEENFNRVGIFSICKNYKYTSFLLAVMKVQNYKKYDHQRMMQKLELNLWTLDKYINPSLQLSLELLSDVYNKGTIKSNQIHFEALYGVSYQLYNESIGD